ncbi:hypothetical protein DFH27DRAFT_528857 [Peziza echinospora]|nr:hypothetical protein DFH27DRAFT_528857 [Peziza echinospora]
MSPISLESPWHSVGSQEEKACRHRGLAENISIYAHTPSPTRYFERLPIPNSSYYQSRIPGIHSRPTFAFETVTTWEDPMVLTNAVMEKTGKSEPTVVLLLGASGCGKTTMTTRLKEQMARPWLKKETYMRGVKTIHIWTRGGGDLLTIINVPADESAPDQQSIAQNQPKDKKSSDDIAVMLVVL